MTNQTKKFTSATEATLTVALYESKTSIKVSVRHKVPGERTRIGCKEYFDLGQDEAAQRTFDRRVQEATAAGWVVSERPERAAAFVAIPPAPGVSKRNEATTPMARVAARR